jgi:hypothetical protein
MMRVAFAFIIITSVIASSVSAEADGGGTVGVGGVAPPVCSFQAAPRQLAATNMSLSGATLSSGQIAITQLADINTARLKSASIQLEILGVCNSPHSVSLKTTGGGLSPQAEINAVGGLFITHVNYRAEAQWAGQTISLLTDSTPGKKSTIGTIGGAYSGPLNVKIIIDGTTNNMTLPTANGVYSDSLIVQIGLPL